MKGILLVSHGKMASGMLDAAKMFFGDNIAQIDYLSLEKEDNAEMLGEKVAEKIKNLDTGNGVIVLADLYGGTPCNQTALHLTDNIQLVSGMNLAMLIEILASREFSNMDNDSIVDAGINGIKDVNRLLSAITEDNNQ